MLATTLEFLSSHPLIAALGGSLLHFLWQGAAVALVLAATLRWMRGRSASARYVASCVALAAMLVLPVSTFIVRAGRASGAEVAIPTTSFLVWAGEAPAASSLTPWHVVRAGVAAVQPWLVPLWLAGVLALSARFVGAWVGVQRLRVRGTSPAPARLRARLEELGARLGVSRLPRLVQSAVVDSPMTLGWVRPVILLPVSAVSGLSPAQLEIVLAHELAHVRRHDYLANLLQTLAESLLFYHPAVWWVSRCVRTERENCCDDLAVTACGDPVSLARALASLEQMRAQPAVTLAAAATDGPLLQRVRRLLGMPAPSRRRPAGWTAALALVATAALIGVGLQRAAVAADREDDPAEEADEEAEDAGAPVTVEIVIPEVPLIPAPPVVGVAPVAPSSLGPAGVAPAPPEPPEVPDMPEFTDPPEPPAIPDLPPLPALDEMPPFPEVPEIPSHLSSEKALERYMNRNAEEWERFDEDMERWAEAFEADERWERFGEQMEAWAEGWAEQYEGSADDYAVVWMGGHGCDVADELQRQADELERQAEELRRKAEELEREAEQLERDQRRDERQRQRGKRSRGRDEDSD